jgi:hypothetical protein
VGYRTETLKGNGVFNLFSANLDNPIGAAGTIDVIAGTTLTDNEANFTAAFTAGTPLTLKIVEAANASAVGLISDVTAFTATTVTTADNLSSVLAAGAKYQLRATPTVASTFGADNSAGLAAGTSATADLIWIPTGDGNYSQVFRSSGGLVGAGWRRVGGGAVDASNDPISIVDGIFVQRKAATDLNVVFTGHVQTTKTRTGVITGYNPVSRVLPVGLTLADSQLQTELTQGTSATADLLWNPKGDGTYDQFFYSSGGLVGMGWRKVGGGAADQATSVLSSGFLVQRKGAATNITIQLPSGLDI